MAARSCPYGQDDPPEMAKVGLPRKAGVLRHNLRHTAGRNHLAGAGNERGLQLSPEKTAITHVADGFDFLGQNIRRYPNGKLLIKPSRKSIKSLLTRVKEIVREHLGDTAHRLITRLNPVIRGWANYHRHVVSKRIFARIDAAIFRMLWQWACARHPRKGADGSSANTSSG